MVGQLDHLHARTLAPTHHREPSNHTVRSGPSMAALPVPCVRGAVAVARCSVNDGVGGRRAADWLACGRPCAARDVADFHFDRRAAGDCNVISWSRSTHQLEFYE